jgi:hypothetical protein
LRFSPDRVALAFKSDFDATAPVPASAAQRRRNTTSAGAPLLPIATHRAA